MQARSYHNDTLPPVSATCAQCQLTPCLQPYAGLLPPRVLEPGKPIDTITQQMSQLTGLPKGCLVCAGTSGTQLLLAFLWPV